MTPHTCRLVLHLLVLLLAFASNTHGGCEFPAQWHGTWFQSGFGQLALNRSSIETKGECVDSAGDKFMVHDRQDDCYRCMVIHEKHAAVLQYKETYCDQKASLQVLCYTITGDAPLYSMFRKHPPTAPVPCPFKAAPFTFSYNRGSGECSNPPSRAESCTDDSRLVLKYQACPDIQSTESNVEQLICVATWKEGSTRYLVGRVTQVSRRSALSDEDQYRCFIYERLSSGGSRVTYHVAQSGDATCNGLQSATEGSRTMRLTTADSHHGRCRFPTWITDHHTWFSLDHANTYKFSLRNATLKIRQHDDTKEVRVVCHSILQAVEGQRVQIVAHLTRGCDSGYVCMLFHKRDSSVIEIQQLDARVHEVAEDACRYFDPALTPYTTLIAPSLHAARCPHPGKYSVLAPPERRRRQLDAPPPAGPEPDVAEEQECLWHDYEAMNVGCGTHGPDVMEFRSTCPHQPVSAYTCHGSWLDNLTYFLIASPIARKSTDALRYCLVYSFDGEAPATPPSLGAPGANASAFVPGRRSLLRLSGLADSCHRTVRPGSGGLWRFNFTTNGGCTRGADTSAAARAHTPLLLLACSLVLTLLPVR